MPRPHWPASDEPATVRSAPGYPSHAARRGTDRLKDLAHPSPPGLTTQHPSGTEGRGTHLASHLLAHKHARERLRSDCHLRITHFTPPIPSTRGLSAYGPLSESRVLLVGGLLVRFGALAGGPTVASLDHLADVVLVASSVARPRRPDSPSATPLAPVHVHRGRGCSSASEGSSSSAPLGCAVAIARPPGPTGRLRTGRIGAAGTAALKPAGRPGRPRGAPSVARPLPCNVGAKPVEAVGQATPAPVLLIPSPPPHPAAIGRGGGGRSPDGRGTPRRLPLQPLLLLLLKDALGWGAGPTHRPLPPPIPSLAVASRARPLQSVHPAKFEVGPPSFTQGAPRRGARSVTVNRQGRWLHRWAAIRTTTGPGHSSRRAWARSRLGRSTLAQGLF